jgi:hypothetical protein
MQIIEQNSRLRLTRHWIRPISLREKGEINRIESRTQTDVGTKQPAILDVIDIPLGRKAQVAGQPEDWYIDPKQNWRFRGTVKKEGLSKLVQTPSNLWLENRLRPDRVSPTYLFINKSPSLYLINATNFRIEITETADFNTGLLKKKRRGKFSYNGINYDFALTDPVMQSVYFPSFPNVNVGILKPGPPLNCRLCISLAPDFNGYHYKLVAAVIDG